MLLIKCHLCVLYYRILKGIRKCSLKQERIDLLSLMICFKFSISQGFKCKIRSRIFFSWHNYAHLCIMFILRICNSETLGLLFQSLLIEYMVYTIKTFSKGWYMCSLELLHHGKWRPSLSLSVKPALAAIGLPSYVVVLLFLQAHK